MTPPLQRAKPASASSATPAGSATARKEEALMKITINTVAVGAAVLGVLASLFGVIRIWIRDGSPIIYDADFVTQPLFPLGLAVTILICLLVVIAGEKKKEKANDET